MGGVAFWAARQQHPVNLGRALELLCHRECFSWASHIDTPTLKVGSAYRDSAPPSVHVADGACVAVALYGAPLLHLGGWLRPTAEQVARRYGEQGRASLLDLDGSFLAVVVDMRASRLVAVNDRIASVPLVYAQRPGQLAAAPEAKALFALLGLEPRLDEASVVSFLNLGYPIGDQTMFESVRMLEPASALTVDLLTATVTVERYWDLRFSAGRRVTARQAASDLATVVTDATRASLVDSPRRVQLLLTGGLDSRALLGTMCAVGRPPDETLTWGVADELPSSDPSIARQLSAVCGVPHRFLRYGAETFVDEALRWTAVSELSSDNAGNFTAGAEFLYAESPPADAVMIGDQMFGPGGLPGSLGEAEQSITKLPPGRMFPRVESIMQDGACAGVRDAFLRTLSDLTLRCGSDDPKDAQDYLFLHLYVFRWLCAAAYFREPMVSARRPLLHAAVLDFVSGLPSRLRVDKVVLVRLVSQSMKDLARLPRASAHSLVDWSYEMRVPGRLRDYLRSAVTVENMERTPLGRILDRERLNSFVSEFFAAEPRPVSRRPTLAPGVTSVRSLISRSGVAGSVTRWVGPLVRRAMRISHALDPHRLMLRLAQLALLQEVIDRGMLSTPGMGATNARSSSETASADVLPGWPRVTGA